MTLEELRELKVLNEIASGSETLTQRSLARTHGVALGLANLLIRRLASKGFIQMTSLKGNRLRYFITPQGLAEKVRLSDQYLEDSLHSFREIRRLLSERLARLSKSNRRSILLVGTDELAEIVCLTSWELGLTIAGVLDDVEEPRANARGSSTRYELRPNISVIPPQRHSRGSQLVSESGVPHDWSESEIPRSGISMDTSPQRFLSYPVHPFSFFPHVSFDGIVITSMKARDGLNHRLVQAQIPEEAIVVLSEKL